MADWTNIPDMAVDPDAPLTSELGYAWRDNPIAIADGALGAPKVKGRALDVYLGGGNLPHQGSGAMGFSDLDRETFIMVFGTLSLENGATQIFLSASYSGDNGGTWTGWSTIVTFNGSELDMPYTFTRMLNLKAAGAYNAVRFAYTGVSSTVGRGEIHALSLGGLP